MPSARDCLLLRSRLIEIDSDRGVYFIVIPFSIARVPVNLDNTGHLFISLFISVFFFFFVLSIYYFGRTWPYIVYVRIHKKHQGLAIVIPFPSISLRLSLEHIYITHRWRTISCRSLTLSCLPTLFKAM
jgi:hypothetical protein